MRINVYTEELLPSCSLNPPVAELVYADYVSSRTGEATRNWGIRVYLRSAPELHYIPGRDDDRSAITFWCGGRDGAKGGIKKCFEFWDGIRTMLKNHEHTVDHISSGAPVRQDDAVVINKS